MRAAIGERLLPADGAMGSVLQGSPTTLGNFAGHEGGNETLNVNRPGFVRSIHDRCLDAGVDCITTNTFGATAAMLPGSETGIAIRAHEPLGIDVIGLNCSTGPAEMSEHLRYPAWRYQGCRYALGYPACPDLEDRATVMRPLEPERIGITLSEDFQLAPEQSTDAVIAHQPEASCSST